MFKFLSFFTGQYFMAIFSNLPYIFVNSLSILAKMAMSFAYAIHWWLGYTLLGDN